VLLVLGLLMLSHQENFVTGIGGLAVKWDSQLSLWKALSSWKSKTTAKINSSSEQHTYTYTYTYTYTLSKLFATLYPLLSLSKKRNSHNLRQEIWKKLLGRFRLVPEDNTQDWKETCHLLMSIIILINTNSRKSELKRTLDRFRLFSEDNIKTYEELKNKGMDWIQWAHGREHKLVVMNSRNS
jgi:hypothetical protein